MAATSNKRTKRRRGRARKVQKKPNDRLLTFGVATLVIGLLVFGSFQVFGNRHNQPTAASSVVQADSDSLESLSIADNQGQHAAEVVPITDRETKFLGPASDSATLALAEAGQLGQPTLLWFHADW